MAAKKGLKHHPRIPLPASLPSLHALLTPAVAHAFDTLRIGAALRDKDEWYAIHVPQPQPTWFELAHGREAERDAYNNRCTEQARRTRKAVLGQHAGFCDFFVPIATGDTVHAVLITGPFSTARPTSSDVLERWHSLTGRHGQPSDPEFAHYLWVTLDTLLLEGEQLGRYERMLHCFASLSAGRGDALALAAEAASLREKLQRARFFDRVCEEARSMVDERTARVWLSPHRANDLSDLGLTRPPEHVLVGLMLGRGNETDAVDDVLRRDAFQRACVELARSSKNVVCGRVADHGVMFLLGGARSVTQVRHTFTELGNQATALARRRFGLSLHLGTSSLEGTVPISVRYEEALGAAESALSQGLSLVSAAPRVQRRASPVRQLREQLASVSEERPKALVAKFERYIEAVGAYSGYRLELVRAHLDAGFEQAARTLLSAGVMDEASRLHMYDGLDRAARDASTVSELFVAYRRAISDLVDAAERPVPAAQDRNLRRAVAFIHEHFAEPLSLIQVSHVAGFAPAYFCQLFKRRERMTFEQYVRQLRIERAKQLLTGTDLSVERIGQLSGYALRHYFHRVFKQAVGTTPVQFREAKR